MSTSIGNTKGGIVSVATLERLKLLQRQLADGRLAQLEPVESLLVGPSGAGTIAITFMIGTVASKNRKQ